RADRRRRALVRRAMARTTRRVPLGIDRGGRHAARARPRRRLVHHRDARRGAVHAAGARAVTPTFADLVAAGRYDPDAPDADVRRQLLEPAVAVGAGLDDFLPACAEGWLQVVPTRPRIPGGA